MVVSSDQHYHSWLGPARNAAKPFEDTRSCSTASSSTSHEPIEENHDPHGHLALIQTAPRPHPQTHYQFLTHTPPQPQPEWSASQRQSLQSALMAGGFLWKLPFDGSGQARRRWFQVVGSVGDAPCQMRLEWHDPSKAKRRMRSVALASVLDLSLGPRTRAFHSFLQRAKAAPPVLCFSLHLRDRTVDLIAESMEQREMWTQGLKQLIAAAYIAPVNEREALFQACYSRDCCAIRDLLHGGNVDVNALEPMNDGSGDSVLIIAARLGFADVVELCLQFGAVNDAHPGHGQTALHAAVSGGHAHIAKILLDTAAITQMDHVIANHPDADTFTPLHIACYYGKLDLVELLIEHGADVGLIDGYGQTCIHTTSASAFPCAAEILSVLFSAGGDEFIDSGDAQGNTCLHLAAQMGNAATIRCLLQSGANPCIVNSEGMKPYELSVQMGSPECMALLREYEAWHTLRHASARPHPGKIPYPDRRQSTSCGIHAGREAEGYRSGLGERIRAELYYARRGQLLDDASRSVDVSSDNLQLHIEQTRESWSRGQPSFAGPSVLGGREREMSESRGQRGMPKGSSAQLGKHDRDAPGCEIAKAEVSHAERLSMNNDHGTISHLISSTAMHNTIQDVVSKPADAILAADQDKELSSHQVPSATRMNKTDGLSQAVSAPGQEEDVQLQEDDRLSKPVPGPSAEKKVLAKEVEEKAQPEVERCVEEDKVHEGFKKMSTSAISSSKPEAKRSPLKLAVSAESLVLKLDTGRKLNGLGKYFNMKRVGVSAGSIKQKMIIDGRSEEEIHQVLESAAQPKVKSEGCIKASPAASAEGSTGSNNSKTLSHLEQKHKENLSTKQSSLSAEEPRDVEPERSQEEWLSFVEGEAKYAKYLKMRKMGVHPGAISNSMARDGLQDVDIQPFLLAFEPSLAKPQKKAGTSAAKSSSLLKLHWNALQPDALENTVWAESSQNVLGDDDLIQLEDLFRKKPAKAKRRADQKAKSQRRLFDIKRENNVAIALVKLKKTFPEGFRPMVDAIESQDLAKLPLQSLVLLLGILPSKEETVKVSTLSAETAVGYGPVAAFFHALLPLEQPRPKVEELIFQLQFADRIADVRTKQSTITQSCEEIVSSKRLQRVLEIILQIGNVMNRGTCKGNAAGFTLDSLSKLVETKGKDSKTTLMDYVARMALKSKELRLATLAQDMPSLEAASQQSIDELCREISALDGGLNKIEQAGRSCAFVQHARADLEVVHEHQALLVNKLNSTESYFSGSTTATTPRQSLNREAVEMLKQLHVFVTKFSSACRQNRPKR